MAESVSGRRATQLVDSKPSRLARDIVRFAEHLRVPEGDLRGKPLQVVDFQRDFIRRAFPANRQVRRAILSIGRKNAKTALVAVLVLAAGLGPLAVRNSEIISAARSRDQASMVFRYAKKMLIASRLLAHVVIRDSRREIYFPRTGVTYRAVSADAPGIHGAAPVLVIHDELGQVKGADDALYDALSTSMGAYESGALEIVISTQAPTDADLLSLLIDDALAGGDPTVACVLYAAAEDADPFSLEAWQAANPALGLFRSLRDVETLAEQARRVPAREGSFRNLILNQRVQSESPWLSRSIWNQCAGAIDLEIFRQRPVYAGLDLSSRQDLSALLLAAEDEPTEELHVLPYFWTPADTLHERAHRDRAPYGLWVDQGHLETTPGSSIDYGWIAARLAEVCGAYRIERTNYDRWRIEELRRELGRIGARGAVNLTECGQGYASMTPACEAIEHAAVAGKLRHGGHPVLTWCVSNAVATMDPAGNRKLDKKHSYGRIDGAVALAMAGKAARVDAKGLGQVRTRGLIIL